MCFVRLTTTLACLGMLLPPGGLQAAERTGRPGVSDIQLTDGGTLIGTVVNARGRTVPHTPVVVRFSGQIVARTTTNVDGRFAVQGLRGGFHQLHTRHTSQAVRFWAPRTAPAGARPSAVVVSDARLVRGQNPGLLGGGSVDAGLIVGGLAVAGIATAIAVAANDDDDDPPASP